jgi:hypothetical protein
MSTDVATDVKYSRVGDSSAHRTLFFEILLRRVTGAVVAGSMRGGIIFDKDHVE